MTMNSETRKCQNCEKDFVIEPEDFGFYEKIKVPPPTWCSECRLQRRLIWRNERTLYKRKSDVPGSDETVISNYSSDSPSPVYSHKYWWSDEWDASEYGVEYDFKKPFFEQFLELSQKVPVMNLTNLQSSNSDYCNFTYQAKNCYLNFASDINEDTAYVYHTIYCKDSFDLLSCKKMEKCGEGIHSFDSYSSSHLMFSHQCLNSHLLYNCHNCQNCVGCVNLRSAKYQIFNEQYTPEEYKGKLASLNLGSYQGFQSALKKFHELMLKHPRKYADVLQVQNVSGDYILNAKNCRECFDIEGPAEDCKFVLYGVPNLRDCYDGYGTGNGMEIAYEVTSAGGNAQRMFFSPFAWIGSDYYYSSFCDSCSNIFGCVGLRNKEYCILNKQYTRQEYGKMVPKIIEHMNEVPYTDRKGRVYRYGEFFPPELSPFAYNETIAQEYFPLTKEEAIEKGYRWRDPETRGYKITKHPEDLPDNVKDTDDAILKETIACEHEGKCNEQCTTAFRIIESELQFYRKMNLPLPRLCPNCRHYQRLKKRNPLKLWHGKCKCAGAKSENEIYTNSAKHQHGTGKCPNEFETSYAPERPEIVYCETCYQKEVI